MNSVEKILYKISQCIDYQNLYALEEELNSIGLSIQTTSKNRMILCKLREGRIVAKHLISDYIFVGNHNEATRELSENVIQKISDFVRNHRGKPDKVKDYARVWRNGLRMYESVIIVNEDIHKIADDLIME